MACPSRARQANRRPAPSGPRIRCSVAILRPPMAATAAAPVSRSLLRRLCRRMLEADGLLRCQFGDLRLGIARPGENLAGLLADMPAFRQRRAVGARLHAGDVRSEERRVGKGGGGTCKTRWSP